ncbi:hypothetical protein E2542_SST28923 [Spatholobus suberectus]|nr:hypothetical protein E2542_SST28923 [Spatholobus suberectus]
MILTNCVHDLIFHTCVSLDTWDWEEGPIYIPSYQIIHAGAAREVSYTPSPFPSPSSLYHQNWCCPLLLSPRSPVDGEADVEAVGETSVEEEEEDGGVVPREGVLEGGVLGVEFSSEVGLGDLGIVRGKRLQLKQKGQI